MLTILTIISDPKKTVLFRNLFLKIHLKVLSAEPTYGSYIKALQYDPDIILMELPADPKTHLRFLLAVRNNKALSQKPFILLGPAFDEKVVQVILTAGANAYLPEPLDMKKLIDTIRSLIQKHSTQKRAQTEKNQIEKNDLAQLYDKSIAKQIKIDIMRNHIGKLLAFPATVASILKVTQNERSGAGELANVLKSDPAVSAEILRIVNSVFYSRGGGKRIFDVKDAVVRIGFVETKNIAMSLSVFKVMSDKNYATGFDHGEFWFHCLATAIIAEHIAKLSQLVSPEEAFIGALLHDLGTLLFNEYFNDLFLLLLDKTTSEGMRFIQMQNAVLGFNHNDLMEQLFQEWKFPDAFCGDIHYFGSSEAVTKEFLQQRPLPAIINISEIIAKSYQIGQEADCCVDSISNEVFERLRMPFGIQLAFLEKIYNELNMYNTMLKISKGTFPQSKKLIQNADKINLLCYSFGKEVFSPVIEYLKVQGYNIKVCSDITDFAEKGIAYHAFLLTDGHGALVGDINEIAKQQTKAFSATGIFDSDLTTPSKVVVFDTKNDLSSPFPQDNVVTSRYPVDLRNVDIVFSCLLQNHPNDLALNEFGSFKPTKRLSNDGKEQRIKILLAHFKSEIRKKIVLAFKDQQQFTFEEADDGVKAVNFARTSKEEIMAVIVQLSIPMLPSKDVVLHVKSLPQHKRAKYILCIDNSVTKEQLVPLVQLGIRSFIKESMSDDELVHKICSVILANKE